MCSKTSNDIFVTIGHVPETITMGTTANTGHIAEFVWYDWLELDCSVHTATRLQFDESLRTHF